MNRKEINTVPGKVYEEEARSEAKVSEGKQNEEKT